MSFGKQKDDAKLSTTDSSHHTLKSVCLFGSSVDPPTRAHVAILEHFVQTGDFNQVWLLPVYKHAYASKSNLIDFHQRFTMCQLACDGLQQVIVSDKEQELFEAVYRNESDPTKKVPLGTVDLLQYLKKQYKNIEFSFVLGEDAFIDLCDGKWIRGNELAKLVHLQVVRRDSKLSKEALRRMAYGSKATFHVVNTISEKVSSTQARKSTSLSELTKFVPNKVATYIEDNSLYSIKN